MKHKSIVKALDSQPEPQSKQELYKSSKTRQTHQRYDFFMEKDELIINGNPSS